MKRNSTLSFVALLFALSLGLISFRPAPTPVKPTSNYYDVQFTGIQKVGMNYEWNWTVTNPNPGNGLNGTIQNLSHWSLAIDALVNIEDIADVAYSTDGTNWMPLPIAFAIDKSQTCLRSTVLKFDHGTTGSAPTYYRLTVNKEFSVGPTVTNFKSGSKTGCYNGMVAGIGVPYEEDPDR